mmetsp:Transcript_17369/g.54950  ORF Transcript_17369/g.54950 Transcript_17369/m.54950 type:complete len:214 (+) Transcript_17369:103-744(+)
MQRSAPREGGARSLSELRTTDLLPQETEESQLLVLRLPGARLAKKEAESVQELRGRAVEGRLQVSGHDALEGPAGHVRNPLCRLLRTAAVDEEAEQRVDDGRRPRELCEVRLVTAPSSHEAEGDGLVAPLLRRDRTRSAVVAVGLQDPRGRCRELQGAVRDEQGPGLPVEERDLGKGVRDGRLDEEDLVLELVRPRRRGPSSEYLALGWDANG